MGRPKKTKVGKKMNEALAKALSDEMDEFVEEIGEEHTDDCSCEAIPKIAELPITEMGREDLNLLRDKVNEIIKFIN